MHRMHEMAGNISGDFNEPLFAESTTVRRSNRANTDRVCIPRSRFSECVSEFIYSWKKSGFDSRESAGKASYYLAVTRRKRAFLGSIPPRIDGRSGRQVRRIENVNSNRSEPLGSSFLDGVPLYTESMPFKKLHKKLLLVVMGG